MKKDELHDRLKSALTIRGLKQADLVEQYGFDKGQLSSWLSGRYKPRQNNISKLAEILSLNEAWLMGYDVPMEKVSANDSLSVTDMKDIKKDLDSLMNKLSIGEYGPAAYDGEPLSPESIELFRDELEIALKRLKLINKEKYNPNKNKK